MIGSRGRGGTQHLLVCAPLRVEATALRRGLGGRADVVRTGYGPSRSAAAAARLAGAGHQMMAVGGVAAGLGDGMSVGDVVVASQVSDGGAPISCDSAPLLAGRSEERRVGKE